jgi:hypothetical protein
MVTIKCINPSCSAPNRKFEWDESKHVEAGGGLAQPHEAGAARMIAVCSFCGTENIVWVKNAKQGDVLTRGGKAP